MDSVVSRLSNDELSNKLRSYGVRVGPIVGSTRHLYEKKLMGLLAGGRRDAPAPPVLPPPEPRAGEPVTNGGAIRHRLPGSASAAVADLAALYPDLKTILKRDADQPQPLFDGIDAGGRGTEHDSVSTEVGGRHEEEPQPWARRAVKLYFLVMLVGLCLLGYYQWQHWEALLKTLEEAGRAAVGSLPAAAPAAPPPPVAPVAPRDYVLKHP